MVDLEARVDTVRLASAGKPFDIQSAGRDQVTLFVQRKCAGAREGCFAGVEQCKEARSAQGKVKLAAGILKRALTKIAIRLSGFDATADLVRVGAARTAVVGAGSWFDRFVQQVGKQNALAFETGRIHVGNVVTDDVQQSLVRKESRYAGEQ